VTPAQIRKARAQLGKMWGLDRPLHAAELGRVLGLKGRDPGESVLDWEGGKPVTGPVSRAIEAWLGGYRPSGLDDVLRR
jgi:hypothetical protein